MPLTFRFATPADHPRVEELAISSFESITWFRLVDEKFGSLNGKDWKDHWRLRMQRIFETQIILLAEANRDIVGFSSGTIDPELRLGYVDLLAVDPKAQGKGYGRQLLNAMLGTLLDRGAEHAYLDCLVENHVGNTLYRTEGFEEVARSIRWFIKIRPK